MSLLKSLFAPLFLLTMAQSHVCPLYDMGLDTLGENTVERTVVVQGSGYARIDTLTRDSLTHFLVWMYQKHTYFTVMEVTTVDIELVLDTTLLMGLTYVRNFQKETVHFKVKENLKGEFPRESFTLLHKWLWNDSVTLYPERDTTYIVDTYEPLEGKEILIYTDLVHGFDSLTIDSLSLWPATECTPEVTAFYREGSKILTYGESGGLFAGLSISQADFLAATPVLPRQNRAEVPGNTYPLARWQEVAHTLLEGQRMELKLWSPRGELLWQGGAGRGSALPLAPGTAWAGGFYYLTAQSPGAGYSGATELYIFVQP